MCLQLQHVRRRLKPMRMGRWRGLARFSYGAPACFFAFTKYLYETEEKWYHPSVSHLKAGGSLYRPHFYARGGWHLVRLLYPSFFWLFAIRGGILLGRLSLFHRRWRMCKRMVWCFLVVGPIAGTSHFNSCETGKLELCCSQPVLPFPVGNVMSPSVVTSVQSHIPLLPFRRHMRWSPQYLPMQEPPTHLIKT